MIWSYLIISVSVVVSISMVSVEVGVDMAVSKGPVMTPVSLIVRGLGTVVTIICTEAVDVDG